MSTGHASYKPSPGVGRVAMGRPLLRTTTERRSAARAGGTPTEDAERAAGSPARLEVRDLRQVRDFLGQAMPVGSLDGGQAELLQAVSLRACALLGGAAEGAADDTGLVIAVERTDGLLTVVIDGGNGHVLPRNIGAGPAELPDVFWQIAPLVDIFCHERSDEGFTLRLSAFLDGRTWS